MSEDPKEKIITDFLETKAADSIVKMVEYLESVISEKEDVACPHCAKVLQLAAPHNTRIAAVRALKELMIDKVKGNKRERTIEEKGMDFKGALEEVSRLRQEKEAAGIKTGKVVKMPVPAAPEPKKRVNNRKHTLKEFRARQQGKK